MSYVNISALTFPEGAGPEIELRNAQKASTRRKALKALSCFAPSPVRIATSSSPGGTARKTTKSGLMHGQQATMSKMKSVACLSTYWDLNPSSSKASLGTTQT